MYFLTLMGMVDVALVVTTFVSYITMLSVFGGDPSYEIMAAEKERSFQHFRSTGEW